MDDKPHALRGQVDDARWAVSWLDKTMPPCLIATTVPVAWSAPSPVLLVGSVIGLVVLNLIVSRLVKIDENTEKFSPPRWRLALNACLVGGAIYLAGPTPNSWLLAVPWVLPAMMFEIRFGLSAFWILVMAAAVSAGLAGVPLRTAFSGYIALLFLGTILLLTADALRGRARALRTTVVQLRDAMAAKETFLATMSHELRTPLNGVIGMAEILSESDMNPEQREHLGTIRSCGRSLLALINDILDLSKIEASAVELERVPFDVVALCVEVLNMARPAAAEKSLGLRLIGTPDTLWVAADPHRLRQILSNLVGNATKFTLEGSVTLEVVRLNPNRIRIEVRDTGIGIHKDKQRHIFNTFSQADESTTRSFGGTGLGLSITRELVELFGGTLGVDSQLGSGTRFWLELPWPSVEPRPSVPELPVVLTPSPDPITPTDPAPRPLVLVVEDNPVNRLVAGRLLERMGLDVEMAHDGMQGVEQFEHGRFAAVLMDLQMPNLDGLGATRRIRSLEHRTGKRSSRRESTVALARREEASCWLPGNDEQRRQCRRGFVGRRVVYLFGALEGDDTHRVPIIAVTASILVADVEACEAAGVDAVLGKPIIVDALRATLTRYGIIPQAKSANAAGPRRDEPRGASSRSKFRKCR